LEVSTGVFFCSRTVSWYSSDAIWTHGIEERKASVNASNSTLINFGKGKSRTSSVGRYTQSLRERSLSNFFCHGFF
jgi:hypothetical protein